MIFGQAKTRRVQGAGACVKLENEGVAGGGGSVTVAARGVSLGIVKARAPAVTSLHRFTVRRHLATLRHGGWPPLPPSARPSVSTLHLPPSRPRQTFWKMIPKVIVARHVVFQSASSAAATPSFSDTQPSVSHIWGKKKRCVLQKEKVARRRQGNKWREQVRLVISRYWICDSASV